VASWPSVLADDEVLAGAILDRLLHKATVLNIEGRSYRLRELDAQLHGQPTTTTSGSSDAAVSSVNTSDATSGTGEQDGHGEEKGKI
jgi:IstB-like ATP binding protein